MKNKIISLVGMSGVGKTSFAGKLHPNSHFHYCVDYAIQEFYLKDSLENTGKSAINNLSAMANFLGKIGDEKSGGMDYKTFCTRQDLYMNAEKNATLHLENIAENLLEKYDFIINDLTGSICEIVNFDDPNDRILQFLSRNTTILHIKTSDIYIFELVKIAMQNPKPLLYNRSFLDENIKYYQELQGFSEIDGVNPDDFFRFIFPRLIRNRAQKYDKFAALGKSISLENFRNIANIHEII